MSSKSMIGSVSIEDYTQEILSNGENVLDWRTARLGELLSFRALERPDTEVCAFLGDGENVTARMNFREGHEWASRVAGLLSRFVSERSRILLCFENGLEAVVGLFGCTYANCVPVSGVYPSAVGSSERFFEILEDSEAVAVLGLRETLMDFRRQATGKARKVKWIPIEGAEKAEPLYLHKVSDMDDVAIVQYTSGSVGRPRGVQITHLNLGANLSLLLDRTGFFDGCLGLSWLPLSHDMGLITGMLIGAVVGGPCWLMRPEHFIEKPERWLKIISRYRVGFSAGPNFAYELLARQVPDDVMEELDLSCWQRSVVGAEMIEYESVSLFLKRFADVGVKDTLLRPGYGMAETTLMIASGGRQGHEVVTFEKFSRHALSEGVARLSDNPLDERILASCGDVVEEHEIAVVDPETGERLPEGAVGELWLSGASISPGYLNRPIENKERFGLLLGDKSFFRSRDMGFFFAGQLYVTGRMENRIHLEHAVFDPDDLAHVIRKACPLFLTRSLAVFCCNKTLCVVGEISSSARGYDLSKVMQTMSYALKRVCTMKRLRCVLVRGGGISRTPSGKIRVSATARALEDGKLPVIQERIFDTEELQLVEILDKSYQIV